MRRIDMKLTINGKSTPVVIYDPGPSAQDMRVYWANRLYVARQNEREYNLLATQRAAAAVYGEVQA
jgi:hypothetical protein